jgi:hypothetical protein
MAYSGFIVRPFNTRQVLLPEGDTLAVDFEAIEALLIHPAMRLAGVQGATTQEIMAAGNIREDMFQQLAHADVVVAEISLHNANVFYELGARHALRKSRTCMIRFATSERVPFDISTDRYLAYDPRQPGASVEALTRMLQDTLANRHAIDSPIFKLLPALRPPSVAELMPVPPEFQEELDFALENKRIGHLVLLGQEAKALRWGAEGLRLVGRALVELEARGPAVLTWEALRQRADQDVEADLQLATLYQRLDRLADSDNAIGRVLDDRPQPGAQAGQRPTQSQRAEALALRGSNAKQRWRAAWSGLPADRRQAAALQSPNLARACSDYADAFAGDLNHHYSGANALTLAHARLALAQAHPEAWADGFADDNGAERALEELQDSVRDLLGAVRLSVQAAQARLQAGSREAPWVRCSAADVQLRHPRARAGRIVAAYRQALEGAPPHVFEAQRRQWALLQNLGLMAEHWPALQLLLDELAPVNPDVQTPTGPERVILFTGHRIDAPGRAVPRFPASAEPAVRQALTDKLQALRAAWPPGCRVRGIAGGASGGDLLFHEACQALDIPTALYLPMPAETFVPRSVEVDGAPGWVPRFWQVRRRAQDAGLLRLLSDSGTLAPWLAPIAHYSIWERNNRWMLHSALALGADRLTLLALWDGQPGDGPGGTRHMVEQVRAAGAAWHRLWPADTAAGG